MNKLITVYLDLEDIPEEVKPFVKYTIVDFLKAIQSEETHVYTTQTHAISSFFYDKNEDGWDIKVVRGDREILFSQLLGDVKAEHSYGREIRLAQNWEKMFYAGCFDVDVCDCN